MMNALYYRVDGDYDLFYETEVELILNQLSTNHVDTSGLYLLVAWTI